MIVKLPKAFAHRALITVAVMLAASLQALDTTIANVALPHIRGSLAATLEQMGWVLSSYIVAAAITTPLAGWLAGQIGRKQVLLLSVIGFTVASALCGMAQTLPQLVVFRLLQGMCGASLVPLSQAVLLDINPPEQHGRATAIWGMGVLVGPIIGPALGGWLTDNASWRWVFYINVPLGLLSALGILKFLRETPARRTRFDFFGFASLSLGIGALQLFLDRGQLLDWFGSTEIWLEATASALALYLFTVHTLTARQPFVSRQLFRDRNFLLGNAFIFIIGVVMFATLALLPPLLQDLMGYPVVTTGLATAPRGIGGFLTMALVGRLVGRVNARVLIALGLIMTAASLWLLCGLSPQMDDRLIVVSGFVQGIGMGFAYVPLAAVAFATLSPQLRSEGTAIFSLLRNIGSSIGIAVTQVLLVRNTQIMHARLAEHIMPYAPDSAGRAAYHLGSSAALAALNADVTRQATLIAYNNDFKLLLVLTVAVMPLLLLLRGRRERTSVSVTAME